MNSTAGRRGETISKTAEENGDAIFHARVNVLDFNSKTSSMNFRWRPGLGLSWVLLKAEPELDVTAKTDLKSWGMLTSGSVSTHQLVSQRLLTVEGPPALVRQFLDKLDIFFARKQ